MKSVKTEVVLVALKGDKVMVRNYRLEDNQWNEGEVLKVSVRIDEDGNATPTYLVITKNPETGKTVLMNVGADNLGEFIPLISE